MIRKVLSVPAKRPSAVKTAVNPRTKKPARRKMCPFLSALPAKYEIYNGKRGSIHGEINDMMPSKNVMIYCKQNLLVIRFSTLYHYFESKDIKYSLIEKL